MYRLSFIAATLLAAATTAQAATLTATWDPVFAGPVDTNNTIDAGLNAGQAFVIEFDDLNGNNNGVFDLSELTSFSGLFYQSFPGDPGTTRENLVHTVAIPGLVSDSGLLGNVGWRFGAAFNNNGTTTTIYTGAFSYVLDLGLGDPDPGPGGGGSDPGPSSVPLPASAWLLMAAVVGLRFARRRADS